MLDAFFQQHPGVASAVIIGLAWLLGQVARVVLPALWRNASNEGLVTEDACAKCDARRAAEMMRSDDLFRLVLEGQAIHTQALIALCSDDEECRDLKAALKAHLNKLASRQIGR